MTPLSREDVYRVLESVRGTPAVLVGGQAVAFWAEHYRGQRRLPELAGDDEIFVSRDVDFLGGSAEARVCAERLSGKLLVQGQPWESLPVSAACVEFADRSGQRRNVDFLINLCGVERADVVRGRAIPFEREAEGDPLYLMDPATCVRTRLANLRVLGRSDARNLRQARVAIWAAREWLIDCALLEGGGVRFALREIEATFRYAHRHRDARHAARHGIEAFESIVPHDGLPMAFRRTRFPQMQRIIASVRARVSARRDGGAS